MKYVCEICGCEFLNKAAAASHEKKCRAKHAALIKVTDLITEAIAIADKASISIVLNELNVVEKTSITAASLGTDGKTVLISID